MPKRIKKLVEDNLKNPPFAKEKLLKEELNFKPCAVNYHPERIKPDPRSGDGQTAKAIAGNESSAGGKSGAKKVTKSLFESYNRGDYYGR